jgi:hypothetical protein
MRDEDAAQQLCRTPYVVPKGLAKKPKRLRQPWTPPPEWRALFRAQATPEMIDDVVAYTASHASCVAYLNGRRTPATVFEMVQDSLGDTFAGVVTWHPDRCSLGMHLKSVIRSRLSHEFERAEHLKHVSLPDVGDRRATEAIAIDAAPSATGRKNRFAEEFTERLRALADGDEPVLQLIECYCDGITERRKVCRATGMTTTTFHNADRRLQRLVTNLPEELRMAALGAMSRDEP